MNVCIGVLCLLQGMSCSSRQPSLAQARSWAQSPKAAHLAEGSIEGGKAALSPIVHWVTFM